MFARDDVVQVETPRYAMPDRDSNDIESGKKGDIFALGGILYFLATGEEPEYDNATQRPTFDYERIAEEDLRTIIRRTTYPFAGESAIGSARELGEAAKAFSLDRRIPHIGKRYTSWERFGKLLYRTRHQQDEVDHSNLLALSAAMIGVMQLGGALAYLTMAHAGYPLVWTIDLIGITGTLLAFVPPLTAVLWTRVFNRAWSVYLPFTGVNVALFFLRQLAPMGDHTTVNVAAIRSFFLQMILLSSVAHLFSCYHFIGQGLIRHSGWVPLLFACACIRMGEQPWNAIWLPFLGWSGIAFMCLAFAEQTRRDRTESIETPKPAAQIAK